MRDLFSPLASGRAAWNARAWFLRLSVAAIPLLALAAGAGVFVDGLYRRDAATIAAQAVAQDWVTLLLAVPLLIVGVVAARRGSRLGQLLALGVLGYAAYGYLLYSFATRHNELFLVYVAALSVSVWGLVAGFIAISSDARQAQVPRLAWRWIGGFFVGCAALFSLLWLSQIVPPLLRGETPASVLAWGTPTNGVHVIDLALLLPIVGWTGCRLWGRDRSVIAVAGVLLFKIATLGIAILAMGISQLARGTPFDAGLFVIFVALTALALTALAQYVVAVRRSAPTMSMDA
jgi:hypothetical protein